LIAKYLAFRGATASPYNTLIVSHLNYGLNIWGWKAERLLKLQKKAVRIIKSAPYRAKTLKKLNFYLFIKYMIIVYYYS